MQMVWIEIFTAISDDLNAIAELIDGHLSSRLVRSDKNRSHVVFYVVNRLSQFTTATVSFLPSSRSSLMNRRPYSILDIVPVSVQRRARTSCTYGASHIQFSFTYEYEFIFFVSIIFPCMYFPASHLRSVNSLCNARGLRSCCLSNTTFIFPFIWCINNEKFLFRLYFIYNIFSLFIRSSRFIGGVCVWCLCAGDRRANEHWIFSINIWTRFFFSHFSSQI